LNANPTRIWQRMSPIGSECFGVGNVSKLSSTDLLHTWRQREPVEKSMGEAGSMG
jgi:hypothetical protein